MPEEQKRGIRQLRRLYLGRLGDVLRQRQAINAQLRSAMPTAMEGGRQMAAGYLKVRTCSSHRNTGCSSALARLRTHLGMQSGCACIAQSWGPIWVTQGVAVR